MKLAVYLKDWFDTNSGGTSYVKYAQGKGYGITDETQAHIDQGHAELQEVEDEPDTAERKADKARRLAEAAAQKQADADAAAQLAKDAADAAAQAAADEAEAAAKAAADAAVQKVIDDQRAEMERLAGIQQAATGIVPDGAPVATREQLDAALAALPGDYTNADFVVTGMEAFYASMFTSADESVVREKVVAGPAITPAA